MKNQIKAAFIEWKALCHVCSEDGDVVPLPLSNDPFLFEHLFRIIEHGAFCTERRKNGHLLPASAGEPQNAFPFQRSKPAMRNKFYRRKLYIPFSALCFAVCFMADGLTPLPAVFYPAVDGLCIDFCIVHPKGLLYFRCCMCLTGLPRRDL